MTIAVDEGTYRKRVVRAEIRPLRIFGRKQARVQAPFEPTTGGDDQSRGVVRRAQDWFGGGQEGEKVPFRTMGNTHNKNAPTSRLASSPLRHRQAPVLSSTAPPFTPIAHNAPADTSEKTRCWRYFFRSHAEVGERTDGAGFHEPQGGCVTHRFELVVTGLARVCVHFIRRVCRATVRVSQQCTPS
jgi:hypothetical protein